MHIAIARQDDYSLYLNQQYVHTITIKPMQTCTQCKSISTQCKVTMRNHADVCMYYIEMFRTMVCAQRRNWGFPKSDVWSMFLSFGTSSRRTSSTFSDWWSAYCGITAGEEVRLRSSMTRFSVNSVWFLETLVHLRVPTNKDSCTTVDSYVLITGLIYKYWNRHIVPGSSRSERRCRRRRISYPSHCWEWRSSPDSRYSRRVMVVDLSSFLGIGHSKLHLINYTAGDHDIDVWRMTRDLL